LRIALTINTIARTGITTTTVNMPITIIIDAIEIADITTTIMIANNKNARIPPITPIILPPFYIIL
jgi:hypothetical protein